jgi:hypothetical protein
MTIKRNTVLNLYKIENFFVFISFFCFIFLWDIQIFFDFRYFILIPVFLIFCKLCVRKIDLKIIYFSFTLLFLLLLHFLIVYFFYSYALVINYKKVILIFFISLVAAQYSQFLFKNLRLLNLTFIILLLIEFFISSFQFINTYNFNQFSKLLLNCDRGVNTYTKIIFKENSHLALLAVPILLSTAMQDFYKRKIDFFLFILFILMNYINYSTTFHAGIITSGFFLIIILIYKKNYTKILLTLFFIFFSLSFLLFDKTCKKKILDTHQLSFYLNSVTSTVNNSVTSTVNNSVTSTINNKEHYVYKGENLTSLVQYSALLVSLQSLKNSSLMGVGFDNYEIAHNLFRDKYHKLLPNELNGALQLNRQDASSNLIKIITEFGIFTFFFVFLFIYFILKNKESLYVATFLTSAIIVQLLRGAGYFNAGFVMFALIMIWSVFSNYKKS